MGTQETRSVYKGRCGGCIAGYSSIPLNVLPTGKARATGEIAQGPAALTQVTGQCGGKAQDPESYLHKRKSV